MIDIIPGILEKDWDTIESKLRVVAPHVDWVQVDIADNTLVPNETFLDFSKFAAENLPSDLRHLSFEAHLMVANPEKYIKPLADAGFKRIIAHVECTDPRLFLDEAKYEHVEVGFAIDGPSDLEIIEPFLDQIDMVLVMTIEAGFSGQEFMQDTVEKIKRIHENLPDLPIEVDGGITDKSSKIARDAGATRLVSTSYIFKHPSGVATALEQLKAG